MNKKDYKTLFGNTIFYQSKLELDFIKACEELKINIENGPVIPYYLDDKKHYYHLDFETNKHLIEIKGGHHWYNESLRTGEAEAKSSAAESFSELAGKDFLFLLDKSKEDYLKVMKEK